MLISEPKIPQPLRNRAGNADLERALMLISEPKIPQPRRKRRRVRQQSDC